MDCRQAFRGLLVVLVMSICAHGQAPDKTTNSKPINVSMIALLATPERYNNRQVEIVGYLRIGYMPEDDSLWLYKEDAKKRIFKNSFGLILTPEQRKLFTQLNESYVVVEGLFEEAEEGSSQSNSGYIRNVVRMYGQFPPRFGVNGPLKSPIKPVRH
jgi:hypothetical protein